MRSLRSRLFFVLLGAFVVAWAIGLSALGIQFARDRTGLWDRQLADMGREIMLSMPSDVRMLSGAENLKLKEGPPRSMWKMGRLRFQIWIKSRREIVVHSATGSGEPLKPDFVDGYATATIDGAEWRIYAVSDAHDEVQVQVGKATSELTADLRKAIYIGLGISLLALLVLGVAMKIVIAWSLKPVVKVQEAITSRDNLDLKPLPDEGLPDEVRPFVESFNRLLVRLDRAVQNERQFLAEAAHELRTPLAALLTHAEVALRSKSLDEAKPPLHQLVRGVERSARLSQQLLDSARLDVEHRAGAEALIELADIVAVVTHEFETMAAEKRQTIALAAEPGTIVGDVDELGILISNLIDNALRYTPTGGRVAVRCLRDGDSVRLSVRDDGPGVAAADRARVFDRFYRVAGSNERGSGLGLSLVARIAASHGAEIETGVGLDGRGFGVVVSFVAVGDATAQTSAGAAREQVRAASSDGVSGKLEPLRGGG